MTKKVNISAIVRGVFKGLDSTALDEMRRTPCLVWTIVDLLNQEFHPGSCEVKGCRRCIDRLIKSRDANINAWAIVSHRNNSHYPDAGSELHSRLNEKI